MYFYFTDKSGKWHIHRGSLPTENLPLKSIETQKPNPRRVLDYQIDVSLPELICYETLDDVQKDLKHIKFPWFVIPGIDGKIVIGKLTDNLEISSKIVVEQTLRPTIFWFGAELPVSHFLYENNERSLVKKRIQWLVKEIDGLNVCKGITEESLISFGSIPIGKQLAKTQNFYLHVANKPVKRDESHTPVVCEQCVRSTACEFLSKSAICVSCLKVKSVLKQKEKKQQHALNRPLRKNAPLHAVARKKLMQAVKLSRLKQKALEQKIRTIEERIKHESVNLQSDLHSDLKQIMNENIEHLNKESFEFLFWKEQLKAFSKNPHANRWHPMMIRFALYLHLRSPSAYQAIRESKVIRLPCKRTLRDYTNIVHPNAGFRKDVLDDIKHQSQKWDKEIQRYVVLSFDEMSIKDDLVFDSVTGELVGFVNLGENMSMFQSSKASNLTERVANKVLVFMVNGVASPLKCSVAYFATRCCTGNMLFSLAWKAVGYLEVYVGLKVIAMVSDKASANQSFYKMHSVTKHGISYKANNPFATDEKRDVYFFSDAPHLLNTLRNNLANSGSNLNTRLLWNSGKYLLWKHVSDCYENDCTGQVRKLPKLTN